MSKRNPMPAGRYDEVMARDDWTCQAPRFGLTVEVIHSSRLVVHHRRSRGMGGSSGPDIHAADNLIVLCEPCHLWVHSHPAESYALGLMVRR